MSSPSPQTPAGFFQDSRGHNSSMRLMSFVALIASIVFGTLTIANQREVNSNSETIANQREANSNSEGVYITEVNSNLEGVYITFGFLLSAFAPKAVQKFAEESLQKV